MRVLPIKPVNSKIEVLDDLDKTIIKWKNPRGSASRYFVVVFLLAWLGGWAVALYSTVNKILAGENDPFVVFWTIGWTVGGILAIWSVYNFARPGKPEKLILDDGSLVFQAGTPVFQGVEIRGFSKREKEENAPANSKSKYKMPKPHITKVNLERVGERQRLSIDYGAERIEIGYYLSEPEREWLYSVLKEWKGS